MATTKQRTHKDGSVSFEIRVSLGRDMSGKQILKYHTWTPEPGMRPRQIEKALAREAVLFEEKCRSGRVLDTQTKFSDFAERWLDTNKDVFSPAYHKRADDLLVRINAAIGHIQVGKIKPHHLQDFYANLGEAGIKKTGASATSRELATVIKEKEMTRAALSSAAGVAPITITTACQGKSVSIDSAEKIASALGIGRDELFAITNSKEALSPKTILHHHRVVSSILEAAVKWQVIFDNPAKRVEPPKVIKKDASFLDEKEATQVAQALFSAPLKWRTMLMLLMYSGMRRGEVCGLDWVSVDFNDDLVHITKSSQYLAGKGVYDKETKTESSKRVIKLPSEMMDLLHEYKCWQSDERRKMGDRWYESGKVFTQENGLPINPDSVTGWTKQFREANNLPRFTPHSLRHTSATLLIMSGVPARAVAARLGHADVATTNSIYSHTIQTADARASDVLGDIIKPLGAKPEGRNVKLTVMPGKQKPHVKPHKNHTT